MKVISVLRAIAATEYFFLRLPITAVDKRVIRLLPENVPLRRAFARSVGELDVLAGKVTGDAALEGRGSVARKGGHEVPAAARTDAAQVEAELELARRQSDGISEAARIDAMMAVAAQPTSSSR